MSLNWCFFFFINIALNLLKPAYQLRIFWSVFIKCFKYSAFDLTRWKFLHLRNVWKRRSFYSLLELFIRKCVPHLTHCSLLEAFFSNTVFSCKVMWNANSNMRFQKFLDVLLLQWLIGLFWFGTRTLVFGYDESIGW